MEHHIGDLQNRIFIQFYSISPSTLEPGVDIICCSNGFSHILDKVDPIWVYCGETYGQLVMPELPQLADIIYISCFLTRHVHIAWKWALQYPDCTFIIGGPAVWPFMEFKLLRPFPQNLLIREGYAEEIFGDKFDSTPWKVKLPRIPYEGKKRRYQYSYSLGQHCYWAKCRFCMQQGKLQPFMRTPRFEQLDVAPPGLVFIASPSVTACHLEEFPKLRTDDKKYMFNMRAGVQELRSLKMVTPKLHPDRFYICVGIEFPSTHMLQYLRKGISYDVSLDVLNFILEEGYNLVLLLMYNLPHMTMEDVDQADKFFKSIPLISKAALLSQPRSLNIYHDADFEERYRGEPIIAPPLAGKDALFLLGYRPNLSEDEEKANAAWVELLKAYRIKVYEYAYKL